ncbi:MAG: TonB-dependent receptor [Planctomycetes bacterium]|nr:TonB-dependent receptor [Planctomycetota bacterium]
MRPRSVAVACAVLLLAPLGTALAADAPPAAPPAAPAAPPSPAPTTGPADEADIGEVVVHGDPFPSASVADYPTPETVYLVPLAFPAARAVIPPEEVSRAGQTLLEEIVRRRPGVHVESETGTDTKPNIAMRGLDPQRSAELTLLVDGIPLAPAPYGNPGQSLFPFTMERVFAIDMYRGGYTVPYGPNTVGGVINFLSRPIPCEPMVFEKVRFGSFDAWSTYTAVGGTAGAVGVLLEGVHTEGDTFREHGHFEVENFGAKVAVRPDEHWSFLAQLDRYREDSKLAGGLTQAGYDDDPEQSLTDQDYFRGNQDRWNLRVAYDFCNGHRLELLTYGYGGDRTFFLGRPAAYGTTPTSMRATVRPTEVWAVQPEWTFDGCLGGMRHRVRAGVRYLEEYIKNRRVTTPYPAGAPTVNDDQRFDYRAWAGFVEDAIAITPRLTVTPGVRYEAVDIEALNRLNGVRLDDDLDRALPALSVSYELACDWAAYGNFQTSYRVPDIERIVLTPTAEGNGQDLEPEVARTYEVGVRGWAFRRGLFVDVDVFQIDFDDRFKPDPTNENIYFNTGKQRHRGVEVYLDAHVGAWVPRLCGLHAWTAYHYVDTEILAGPNEGNHTRSAPPQKWSGGLRYDHPCGLWAGVDGLWVDESYADEANTKEGSADGNLGIQPSYTTWSARVGWERKLLCDRLDLGVEAGVTNLADEDYFYRRPGKGIIPGPSRAYYGAIQLQWTF